jgi:peptidoglycan/LPS O-acetylase OafA/YrhL
MLGHLSFFPNAVPYPLPGAVAVEAFYIVSGFLITLVLTEKYDGRLSLFSGNRFLRIFPIYWAVLALYVVANIAVVRGWVPTVVFRSGEGNPAIMSAMYWANQHPTSMAEQAVIGFLNLFIFGQDLARGFGEPAPNLHYHMFIYVRVAWTVAVELSFYAIAPFVVRKVSLTALLLVLSLFAQIGIMHSKGNSYDYQLFPFELWLFMAGSLSYRAYAWLREQPTDSVRTYCVAAVVLLLITSLTFNAISMPRLLYLFGTAACLPGVVIFARRNPADGLLGDFSYPLYLIHPLAQLVTIPGKLAQPVAILIVVFLSWLAVRYIERPIERFRQSRVHKSAELPAGRVAERA